MKGTPFRERINPKERIAELEKEQVRLRACFEESARQYAQGEAECREAEKYNMMEKDVLRVVAEMRKRRMGFYEEQLSRVERLIQELSTW